MLELRISALALHPAQDGTAHEGGAAHLVRVRVRVRVGVGVRGRVRVRVRVRVRAHEGGAAHAAVVRPSDTVAHARVDSPEAHAAGDGHRRLHVRRPWLG